MAEATVVSNPVYGGGVTAAAVAGAVGGGAAGGFDDLDSSDVHTRASDPSGALSASGSIVGVSTPGGSVKQKSSLLVAAEKIDRRTALLSGYLRKKNSQNKWQKRYFEIVGNYWVYYKSASSSEMLCAMDLWKAGSPEMVAPSAGDPAGLDASGESAEFAITWDRYRLFRASSHSEAVRWVNAILQVQASRPPEMVTERRIASPLVTRGGGGGGGADATADWGTSKDRKERDRRDGDAGDDASSGGGVCGSCVIM